LEMGADSLVLVDTVRSIEKTFGLKLSLRLLFEELTTLDAVAAYIEQNMPPEIALTTSEEANLAAVQGKQESTNGFFVSEPARVPPDEGTNSGEKVSLPQSSLERIMDKQLTTLTQVMDKQLTMLTQVMDKQLTMLSAPSLPNKVVYQPVSLETSNGPNSVAAIVSSSIKESSSVAEGDKP